MDDDNLEEEYLNHFLNIVDDLPFITYDEDIQAGDEPYTKDMLIEDIISIISDIHKETNIVVVPDPETMKEIADIKFDKHKKDIKEFIFGSNIGNDSIFDHIRKFTRGIEKQFELNLENKYKNITDDDILF